VAGIVLAGSAAGVAERLARVAAADEVGSFNVAPVDLGDVAEVGHLGPVLLQDPAGVGVGLGVPDDVEPGPLQAQLEAADTGEQAAGGVNAHRRFLSRWQVLQDRRV
jgi:hypothetical protein